MEGRFKAFVVWKPDDYFRLRCKFRDISKYDALIIQVRYLLQHVLLT